MNFRIIQHDWSKPTLSPLGESYYQQVDLVVTSPPYKSGADGYSEETVKRVFFECKYVLKPNGLMFVNMGYLQEDFFRPYRLALLIEDLGFIPKETFIWRKNHYKPLGGKKRVNNLYEFIFMFAKGEKFELDRLAVGVPYKDKTNAKRFSSGRDLKCAGNVWDINYPTIQRSKDKPHHDYFPIELPERCIKLAGVQNGLIFDPFGGSGSSGVAAANTGNSFLGVDRSEKWVSHMINRLSACYSKTC